MGTPGPAAAGHQRLAGNTRKVIHNRFYLAWLELGGGDGAKGSLGICDRTGDPGGGGGRSLLDGVWTSIQETEKQGSFRLCSMVVGDLSKLVNKKLILEARGV